ncbi:LOW QUALITY PROTEIN: Gag polyprotein [Plecturocebus cupreus]
MGKSQSKPSILECMVKNFRKGFSGDYEVKMTPERLKTLCEVEWPMFNAAWKVVTNSPGHPDQFPYNDSWLEVAQTLPPWIRFCAGKKGKCKVLVAQVTKGSKIPVHQGDHKEDIPPPPYIPLAALSAPLNLPEMPPMSADTAKPGAAGLEPPCPRTSLARCLWSLQPAPALQMPLRETRLPASTVTDDGMAEPGKPILYYQPFGTTDLLNWKHHTPAYSEKPQALVDLLGSIFQTHQPTWDDCRQLLLTLFNTEEPRWILTEARKWLEEQAPVRALDPARLWRPHRISSQNGTLTLKWEEPPSSTTGRPSSERSRSEQEN